MRYEESGYFGHVPSNGLPNYKYWKERHTVMYYYLCYQTGWKPGSLLKMGFQQVATHITLKSGHIAATQ
jgi:hypothetical protein